MNQIVNTARQYQAEGKPVFPVDRITKKPRVEWKLYQSRLPTEAEVESLWSQQPHANIGMSTGRLSNMVVIDCDSEEAVNRFLGSYPEASATLQAQTARGRHFYFQHEDGIRNNSGTLGPDIDVRGEGGYVIVPPSVHGSGKPYTWLNQAEPQPLPAKLKDALVSPRPNNSPDQPGSTVTQGQRNSTLTSLAGTMSQQAMEGAAVNDPPLSSDEVGRIAKSVARYEPQLDIKTGFNPQSAKEILTKTPQSLHWVWNCYVAKGDLFLFVAFMKVGKSTFFYPLVIAIARGLPFLGYATTKTPVLVLALEENRCDVELRLKKLGMTEDDPIYVHEGPLSEKELANVRQFIIEKQIGLVLLDSLSYYWNVENESQNMQIIRAVKPILELARETGAAIGLIHHENKYGGRNENGESNNDGKTIRGGGALFGLADQAIFLDRRHGGKKQRERVLKTLGRRAESPAEMIIELVGNTALSDPHPYEYRVVKSAGERVADALTDQWQEVAAIGQQAGVSDRVAREHLDELHAEGRAEKDGTGGKTSPFVYRRPHGSLPIVYPTPKLG